MYHIEFPCSTSKAVANAKSSSPKVTAMGTTLQPERPTSTLSQHGGVGPAEEAMPDVSEPSEEDVARAFAMYDTDGIGMITNLALDGT